MYELRLDSRGQEIGTLRRRKQVLAGDQVMHAGVSYLVIDACYDGHFGSAEVQPIKNKKEEAES